MFRLAFVAALLAAAALASAGPTVAAPRAQTVQVTTDQFSKDVAFVGPIGAVNPFGGTSRIWRIRSWLNKETKVVSHQLYVDISYIGSWRWYGAAADDQANALEVIRIGSNVGSCRGGCSMSETVGITLDDSLLRSRAQTGFQIKLSAQSGASFIIDISAGQIAAQLNSIDTYLGVATAPNPSAAVGAVPGATLGADFGASFDNVPGFTNAILGRTGGALVHWVKGDSVAARAGLKWADVIIEFDGQPLADAADLQRRLDAVAPGRRVPGKLVRGRKVIEFVAQF